MISTTLSMLIARTLRMIVVGHALLAALLIAVVGCGSVSPLQHDGGSAGTGGSGRDAGGGSGGSGGSVSCPPTGPCQSCPNGYLLGPDGCPTCQCKLADAGIDGPMCDPGALCIICPNGYLSGPGGCRTCQCKPGDAGADQLACFPLFHGCTADAECCAPNRCLNITGTRQCQQEGPATQSVTLRMVLPAGRSFCDSCYDSHITILDSTGQSLQPNVPSCSTRCSTCVPPSCPFLPACLQTVPTTNEFTWDGTTTTTSTCGSNVTCLQPEVAPSGHYVAHMCATPGNLTNADGGFPSTCTATGPIECVDVPFDFPGPSPVVGTLP